MRARFRQVVAGAFLAAGLTVAGVPVAGAEDQTTWTGLKTDVFGTRAIEDGKGILTLSTPVRAEDAATVPVDFSVALPEGDGRSVKAVTLIIDENPSPVAATFRFGDGQREVGLSTRIRVNSYSYVRAIAETSDGRLYMTANYVKASGGCSAPAGKDPQEALQNLGKMKFRRYAAAGQSEAQIQIRHPNNSGLQMDQVSRLYIPAWFVRNVTVRQGDKTLLAMEGGISISEDPTFRFKMSEQPGDVTVDVVDTENKVFTGRFEGKSGS
ncbi:quinoprotein dehydrogenase-associated SoxYZ-like carrier [Prosthecomicrobium hirschii]|uniref:quinoprotein dehydrogenase-associated SoxYZ-like carrier n=1 Tax=Prosthecodimorpha hirschii TaxID=665126 RepID=UPI0022200C1E|nr:quinoprotein dehydrogenase-associated SoxYZ-like carrier [Prosthecomicrobium hirschii]MCW1843922.1 quinoprotein dehydrogenase-associated SoxYZ-like carrier [Prosthecomicrobium hirschii]